MKQGTHLLPSTISPCQVSFYRSYFKQNTAIYVIDTVSLKYYSYFIAKSDIDSWLRKRVTILFFDFCCISTNFYSERKWSTFGKSLAFKTRFLSRQYGFICVKDKGNIIQISLYLLFSHFPPARLSVFAKDDTVSTSFVGEQRWNVPITK